MKRKYQVAIILVNYNSSEYTLGCVDSILAKTGAILQYQVIVIDNNSRPEEFEKLKALDGLKQVKLFRSKINTGFSGANMIGVQLADADYYYFLNNDCILLNDCISILHSFAEQNAKVGNCTGDMFNADMEYHPSFNYFPSLALRLLGSGALRFFNPLAFPDKHVRLEKPTRVDLISGSSMFVKAVPFEAIGGLDTHYFLYCEEEDIALRLKRVGFETYVVPEAKYQHFIRKSTSTDSSGNMIFLAEFYISLLYFYRKNYSLGYKVSMQILLFLKILMKSYKGWGYFKLAFFIISGANQKYSLRLKQKIRE